MKYAGFDLEIYKDITGVEDWKEARPLGITCASIVTSDGHSFTYYPQDALGSPLPRAMDKHEVSLILADLKTWQKRGYTITTWNGLAFDFAVLHDECSESWKDQCMDIALTHLDMMYHFFCVKGFRVGLDAVSKGLGMGGKTEGMSGAQAPILWQKSPLDRVAVLNYVERDAIITTEIALAVEEQGHFNWTARSGRINRFDLWAGNWLTVDEATRITPPDTSWMDEPVSRAEFMWWI